jgi:hypothetical protein
MAGEDPEERIAELERQLLERGYRHVAEPHGFSQPSPAQRAPNQRVFEATAPRVSWKWLAFLIYGFLFSMLFLPFVLEATHTQLDKSFGEWLHALVFGGYGVGIALAGSGAVRSFFAPRVSVRPTGDGVDVTRRGKTTSFPVFGARLGPWSVGRTEMGSALHLRNGRRRFVIGGQGYLPPAGTQPSAKPVWDVNAYMPAPDFDAFLHVIYR